jgi:hypothetical protein
VIILKTRKRGEENMAKWMFKGQVYGACWGPRPTKVDLDFQDVQKALAAGVSLGDKVSVRVKVGKRRRLFKARLRAYVDRCCAEHANTPYAYFAERG